jgi:hypothetical protein
MQLKGWKGIKGNWNWIEQIVANKSLNIEFKYKFLKHFPTSPTVPASFHPHQPQQNEPIQNVQQSSQNIRQIQQPAPVHYANVFI